MDFNIGDSVKPAGKFKKVVDFLAGADKETLGIFRTFFEGEDSDPIADAKRLQKAHQVVAIHRETIEVALQRGEYIWEEKTKYFERVQNEETEHNSIP